MKSINPFAVRRLLLLLIGLCMIGGCRRSDVREFTIEIPGLTEENKPLVMQAVTAYGGVDRGSCLFDFTKKTLTLRYDSMKVAQENIRQAIERKGIKVVYPEVKGGYAGYLNEKSK